MRILGQHAVQPLGQLLKGPITSEAVHPTGYFHSKSQPVWTSPGRHTPVTGICQSLCKTARFLSFLFFLNLDLTEERWLDRGCRNLACNLMLILPRSNYFINCEHISSFYRKEDVSQWSVVVHQDRGAENGQPQTSLPNAVA